MLLCVNCDEGVMGTKGSGEHYLLVTMFSDGVN